MREADRLQQQSAFPEAGAAPGAGPDPARRRRAVLAVPGCGGGPPRSPIPGTARGDPPESIDSGRGAASTTALCCASTRPGRIGTTPRLSETRGWASLPTTRRESRRESGPPNGLAHIVAALDDWAVCAADPARQDWLLGVARRADPDPWRDRVRDPAVWRDGRPWPSCAQAAPLTEQPVPLLLALGERLTATGEDGVGFLRRVREQYPDDFWANFTLALALHGAERHPGGDPAPALAYYEKALKIRPQAVAVLNDIGLVLIDKILGQYADGRYHLARLVKNESPVRAGPEQPRRGPGTQGLLAPGGAHVPGRLGDRSPVGRRPFQPRRNPGRFGVLDEAIDHYRQALRSRPRLCPGPPLARYRPGRQGPV